MKQELLDYLNAELSTYIYLDKSIDINVQEYCKDKSALITNLIAATEQAIFDVPSEDVCMKEAESWGLCLGAAMNMHTFILNYKKPESDGKAHLD